MFVLTGQVKTETGDSFHDFLSVAAIVIAHAMSWKFDKQGGMKKS